MEAEIKLLLPSRAAVDALCTAAGVKNKSGVHQLNEFFDTKDDAFSTANYHLRLRTESDLDARRSAPRYIVTVKGPKQAQSAGSSINIRPEEEVVVSAAVATACRHGIESPLDSLPGSDLTRAMRLLAAGRLISCENKPSFENTRVTAPITLALSTGRSRKVTLEIDSTRFECGDVVEEQFEVECELPASEASEIAGPVEEALQALLCEAVGSECKPAQGKMRRLKAFRKRAMATAAAEATALAAGDNGSDTHDSPDILRLFTLIYAQNLLLQLIKDIQVYGLSSYSPLPYLLPPCLPPPSTLLLAITIAHAHYSSSEFALLSLSSSALLVLGLHGSQSNHVVLEVLITLSIVLTAPLPLSFTTSSSSSSSPFLSSSKRTLWSTRLTLSMRAILITLYLITAFAKLNNGWHDPSHSCCVHMFIGVVGHFLSSDLVRRIPPTLLSIMPYFATLFELGFPPTLLLALRYKHQRAGAGGAAGTLPLRCLTIAGSAFHVLIALPPPPISVYPFSMLMLPIYLQGLIPNEVEALASTITASLQQSPKARALSTATLTTLIAIASYFANGSSKFEYPPYFSWELGALWTVLAFGCLIAAALLPERRKSLPSTPPSISALRTCLALFPSLLLVLIGASTYIGYRTYPSFAMFSNLLVEGHASNHWLVKDPAYWASVLGPSDSYSPHNAILIVETNHPSLSSLQINLAPLLPDDVLQSFKHVNVTSEFHITPPSWGYKATEEAFRPFYVPVVEVRRRLALTSKKDFFVRYRHVGQKRQPLLKYRRKGGVRTKGSDPSLDEPLPRWRAVLHRYRTFDPAYAPCRH